MKCGRAGACTSCLFSLLLQKMQSKFGFHGPSPQPGPCKTMLRPTQGMTRSWSRWLQPLQQTVQGPCVSLVFRSLSKQQGHATKFLRRFSLSRPPEPRQLVSGCIAPKESLSHPFSLESCLGHTGRFQGSMPSQQLAVANLVLDTVYVHDLAP